VREVMVDADLLPALRVRPVRAGIATHLLPGSGRSRLGNRPAAVR